MIKTNRILVVDDDPTLLEFFSTVLRTHGYEVLEASTGEAGLQATREKRPDVVVMDVRLSGLSGIEACRQIKADAALAEVFVILVSGEATSAAHKAEGLDTGADDYISKPVDPAEFLARIRTVLRLRDATAALRASEQHYRRLVDILPDAVCLIDLEGQLVTVNPQAAAMLGYAEATELVGKSGLDVTPPEEHAHFWTEIAATLDKGFRRNITFILLKKSGQRFPVELSAAVLKNSQNQPIGIVGVLRDITERVHALEVLCASEERFRQLAENIKEVFWMTDPGKKQMIYISPGYEEIWGHTCASLYAAPGNWIEAIHSDDRARMIEAVLTKQISGQYDEVYRIVRPDGSIRWIHDRAFPIRNESGTVYRVAGIAEDITWRKQAEAKYQSIFENAIEGIFQTTPEGRYLSANPALARLLGYDSPEEFIASITDIGRQLCVDPESRRELKRRLETDGYVREFENRIKCKDGSEKWVSVNAQVVRDANGAVLYYEGTSQDITKRKQADDALHESEARQSAIMQSALDAIMTFDHTGRITDINPAAEKIFSCTRSRIVGQELAQVIIPPTLRDWFRHAASLGFSGDEGPILGGRVELTAMRADGNQFPAELTITRIERLGTPMFTAFIRDLSAHKRAEAKLAILAHAVESTEEIICITDLQDRFTFVNRAFQKTYGYTEREVLGKPCEILFSPNNPPSLLAGILNQTRLGGWQGELLNCRKDGSEFPIALSTAQIKDSEGKILGLMGVARDITAQRRAEKETKAFSALGLRLSSAATSEDAARIILEVATELFEGHAGYVHLYSPVDDKIIPILTADTVEGQWQPVPLARSTREPSKLMRLVMQEGPQLINRTASSPLAVSLLAFGDKSRRSASMMYVPIRTRAAVQGILSIQSYKAKTYSQTDLRLLQTLADHCSEALHRIKLAGDLQETEVKYRSIVENATDGIFQTTPDGRYRSANPAMARIVGYTTPAELISSVTDLQRQVYAQPDRRQEFMQLLEKHGQVHGFEFELCRKDGSVTWVSINGRAVRDADGTILFYEGTLQDINLRKQAEAVLRESEERFHTLFASAPIGIALQDAKGRYLETNLAYQQMLGYTNDELRQLGVRRITHQEDVAEGQRLFGELHDGRCDRYQREKRYWTKDGRLVWAQSSASAVHDESGRLRYLISMVEDITARKQAEHLLQIQRDFGFFLSSTNDLKAAVGQLLALARQNDGIACGAVYLVDPKTGALDLAAHDGLSAHFVKRASHFPAPGAQIKSDAQIGSLAGLVEQLELEGSLAREVIPLQHSGRVVAVLVLLAHAAKEIKLRTRQAIDAIAAQAGGAIARIYAEQSLHTNRQLLEKTLHSLRSAVLVIDANTTAIQECNPAATRIFGYSREEMVGQSTTTLSLEDTLPEPVAQSVTPGAKDREPRSEFEAQMRRKDGASFATDQSVAPLEDESGHLVSWVRVIRDITERKRTEEELRQLPRRIIAAQEAERKRVARELHDGVNQLIASAKMRLLKVEENLTAHNPAAREILARCGQLLVQALEENRRIAHDLRPTDLDQLGLTTTCRNFCKEFQTRTDLIIHYNFARLSQRLPPTLELGLFRIMQEALANVEKHARAKTVRVRLTLQNDSLTLKIQDDGRGFIAGRSRSGKEKWSGIGLTNIRERAAALGGTCEMKSAPDRGTTITVRLPVQTQNKLSASAVDDMENPKAHSTS